MSYAFSSFGPDDELRIRDEHAFLWRQLAEVIRLAQTGDRCDYEGIWDLFVRELEQHMRYEENLLFPAFARNGVTSALWASRFRVDHEELRSQCQLLASAPVQPALLMDAFPRLARKLHEHQEREGLVLYPWLAALPPPTVSWGVMRLLIAPPEPSKGGVTGVMSRKATH